jgi:glutamine synthetase
MNHDTVPGMLTQAQLGELIERGDIETVLTVFPDMYGRLMGKRITGHFFMDHVVEGGMHACDYLLACDMEMDVIPGYKYTSWETGYGDFHCVPDFATLRRAAWLPKTAIVLCDLFDQHEQVVEVAPRRMLQRQVARAREAGFAIMGGSEIELYLFDETYDSARAKNYHDLRPIGLYNEDYHIFQGTKEDGLVGAIRRALDGSGVPVEFSKGEAGLGQQEINLHYCDALSQCDRNIIYKHAAKEIAYAQGKAITFMAKWDEKHTGSSTHIHLSLWDTDTERNQFPGDQQVGPIEASDTFRYFLGGWMRRAREFAACYAPYVASYKRYQSRSWAPTGIAWSYDNRTAGFPAPMPTRTSPTPRRSPPGWTASRTRSSRRQFSRGTCTRPRTYRACRRRCARRSTNSSRARSHARPSAKMSSSTICTSCAPSSASSTRW